MSNKNWVCFDCRLTLRRGWEQKEPRCPKCGKKCYYFGYKYRVPPENKVKEWEQLRHNYLNWIERQHALVKEIDRLRNLPPTKERKKVIASLMSEYVALIKKFPII
jgi:hypothetical protein